MLPAQQQAGPCAHSLAGPPETPTDRLGPSPPGWRRPSLQLPMNLGPGRCSSPCGPPLPLAPPLSVPDPCRLLATLNIQASVSPGSSYHSQSRLHQGDCRQARPGSGSLAVAPTSLPSRCGCQSSTQTPPFGPGRFCMPAALPLGPNQRSVRNPA